MPNKGANKEELIVQRLAKNGLPRNLQRRQITPYDPVDDCGFQDCHKVKHREPHAEPTKLALLEHVEELERQMDHGEPDAREMCDTEDHEPDLAVRLPAVVVHHQQQAPNDPTRRVDEPAHGALLPYARGAIALHALPERRQQRRRRVRADERPHLHLHPVVVQQVEHPQPAVLPEGQERVLREERGEALPPPQPHDPVAEPHGRPVRLQLPHRREVLQLEIDRLLHRVRVAHLDAVGDGGDGGLGELARVDDEVLGQHRVVVDVQHVLAPRGEVAQPDEESVGLVPSPLVHIAHARVDGGDACRGVVGRLGGVRVVDHHHVLRGEVADDRAQREGNLVGGAVARDHYPHLRGEARVVDPRARVGVGGQRDREEEGGA
eukprot:CAMPEP_0113239684 /NCGR_PEP_ID=MMETSP0008_2-20120614/5853_1 /TAXON_ID=97485 /ORGANISM="Prymnesium parvum" /LENGTH=377 /DNA_ID=CAMNT_0000086959 /DNA_START=345 /DNA_END=1478 /DNA_ORIENTATION=- /assembly_acc=CAM_ASM_000153